MRLFRKGAIAACALLAMSGVAYALVRIDVDLSSQTMRVESGDGANYVWPISSGRADYLTPRGFYRPQRLFVMVHSAKYHNSPMPHSIFFHGPYAIHGTNAVGSLGRPVSHGCIRLAPANAAMLYSAVLSEGAVISISGSAPVGRSAANHRHREIQALAYAPRHRARSLRQWMLDPVEY
jgi:L,D-transpeptidase catalytic domain